MASNKPKNIAMNPTKINKSSVNNGNVKINHAIPATIPITTTVPANASNIEFILRVGFIVVE